MTDLTNYQWELGGLVFGDGMPIDHEADSDPGSYAWRTQDGASPVGDANTFGRDLIEPGTWNFKLFTNVEEERDALAQVEIAAHVWRGNDVRGTVGKVMELRYARGGRTRRVYGRPRRFAYTHDNRMLSGFIPITCDFKMASELYFDDAEDSTSLMGFQSVTTGGFEAPFETPLTTDEAAASGAEVFTVGGIEDTPMMVDFTGPISDAFVEIDGSLRVQLAGTIPYGVTVTVDARPWVNSIYRDDGASVPSLLSTRTRLPRLRLAPGDHTAIFGGIDETGLARAKVRWRKAYPSV